jgi:predicted lactoylglutathione lyase
MIIGDTILRCSTEQRFKDFTKKEICNAHKKYRSINCIDADSREK